MDVIRHIPRSWGFGYGHLWETIIRPSTDTKSLKLRTEPTQETSKEFRCMSEKDPSGGQAGSGGARAGRSVGGYYSGKAREGQQQ